MAKARKLPSGQWRTLVYDYTDSNGKRHYESFTADTRSESEYQAAEFARDKKKARNTLGAITFGEALESYIDSRERVLSPRTIREYRRALASSFERIKDIPLKSLSQDVIQQEINMQARTLAPKTVRNHHGLISAVLKQYVPNMALNTTLPQKIRPDLCIPSDEDVKLLMQLIKGTTLELPVLLAAFGPMRRGEICALTSDDIVGCTVHVTKNMVMNDKSEWIIKTPKSYAGDRYIEYPQFVADKWQGKTGRLVNMTPNTLTKRFIELRKKNGLNNFRFHDLRHYSASIQHAIGIPDAYIMQRGGWESDAILKSVYRHAMDSQTKEMNNKANAYFEKMQHEIQHE